jgi:hypothetical protein
MKATRPTRVRRRPCSQCRYDRAAANPRLVGQYQADALQNITGSIAATVYQVTGIAAGAFELNASVAQNDDGTFTGSKRSGFSFDAGRVARVSTETRGASAAVAAAILI